MEDERQSDRVSDPYNLNRFVQAQQNDYERALFEIKSGRKRSHWMWYIFPQFDGLGFSASIRASPFVKVSAQLVKRFAIESGP